MNPPTCQTCHSPLPDDAPEGVCPACLLKRTFEEASPPPPPEEELRQLSAAFPQLVIEEMIGQGGMGRVYRAQQPHLNRTVALKVLSAERANDPEWLERFSREARALARLSHPHIVQVYDFGEKPLPHLLMEHIEGVNLRQAMQNGGLTTREALAIVPKLCDALHYAHEHGVLHRDIKPENILIDTEGRVKIVDFGLAKLRDEGVLAFTLTQSGAKLGTLAYMAPEQVEKPADVDHRADIYSLGVVLYEMLTGELPLGRFPTPSEASGVDARLDGVVMRTLEKRREQRPSSANELRTELEKAHQGKAPAAIGTKDARLQTAVILFAAFAGILITLTRFTGWQAAGGFMISGICGLISLWQLRRILVGESPGVFPWRNVTFYCLFSLAYFGLGGGSMGAFFAAMALMALIDGWLRASVPLPIMRSLCAVAWAGSGLGFLILILTLTSVLHEWLADGLKVSRSILAAADAAGLLLAVWLCIPRLRSAWMLLWKSKDPDLRLLPWERLIGSALAVLLVPTFPNWKPTLFYNAKPVWQGIAEGKPSQSASPAETLREKSLRKYEAEKPIRDKTQAWVSTAMKSGSVESQRHVLGEVHAALRSDEADTVRAALNTITSLYQLNYDHTPFREAALKHLNSKLPDVRIAALNALRVCNVKPGDRASLDKLATECTEEEISSLLWAYRALFGEHLTGQNSVPVLRLLERGMAAALRDRSMYGIDSRHILGVLWGTQVSPEIEARLIEWSHLDKDEQGDMLVGNSRLGYNTLYHALSVVQNKSRAAVKRLMELAYHPDITNVAGRCLWGMNGSVPEAADRAYLAGEVIKLLGLRSDDYLWDKGLQLLSGGITPEHLPTLQELAQRETLPQKRREELQQLIVYLQPKP
ncbi:MAG: serine/threonine-protein kinase [Prosthecobacter sp.]